MGSILLDKVSRWADREAHLDPDAAVPVGSLAARDVITLTDVRVDDSMRVQFGGEIGLHGDQVFLWRDRPIECRASSTKPADAVVLSTLELETKRRELRGREAVFCLRPYSLDWFAWSRFKRVKRQSRHENDLMLGAILAQVRDPASAPLAVWTAVSQLETDPFGGEDYYYARVRDFLRTDGLALGGDGGYSDRASVHEDTKANRRPPARVEDGVELSFGVCDDVERTRGLLEVSDLLMHALSDAEQGEGVTHDGQPLPLTASAQALARAVWQAAIAKALAGPGRAQRARLQSLSALVARHGDVAVLAWCIFHDDLRNLSERADSELAVFTTMFSDLIGSAARRTLPGHIGQSEPSEVDETEWQKLLEGVPARVAEAREQVAGHRGKIDGAVWRAVRAKLSSSLPREVVHGCVYTAALSDRVPVPDDVLQMLRTLRDRQEYGRIVAIVLGDAR